jgi:hypothetical protein
MVCLLCAFLICAYRSHGFRLSSLNHMVEFIILDNKAFLNPFIEYYQMVDKL